MAPAISGLDPDLAEASLFDLPSSPRTSPAHTFFLCPFPGFSYAAHLLRLGTCSLVLVLCPHPHLPQVSSVIPPTWEERTAQGYPLADGSEADCSCAAWTHPGSPLHIQAVS